MNTYKKAVVIYYMVIVAIAVGMAFHDSVTFERLITVLSVAIIPVILTALRTTNFWHDDPNAVAKLKKDHAETIAKSEAIQQKRISDITAAHAETIKKLKEEHAESYRKAITRPSASLMQDGPYPTTR